jgi:transcriptional regulator with XRE-family HTH domain
MKPIPHTVIAKMRQERGVLAKQLAGKLEVSDVHLSYVENGHRKSTRLVQAAVAFLSTIPKKS